MHHFLCSCRDLLLFGCTLVEIVTDMFGLLLLLFGVYLLFTPHALRGKQVLLCVLVLAVANSLAEWCLKRWSPSA